MTTRRPGTIVLVVALLIALRVLGISALIPVFAPYGATLTANTFLVGVAFGAYGLTMALMQVPMGTLSDRFGRKRLIIVGLLLYVAGNALAWWAPTIGWLIAARLLEGVGAVSSVAMALLADAVPEERRTFSIAMAGIGAGLGFLLGLGVGPLVAGVIGVPGIFLASAVMGVGLLVAVLVVVPEVPVQTDARGAMGFWSTLADRRAMALDFAGFVMNTTLTAGMFALSLLLVRSGVRPDAPLGETGYRWFLFATVLIGGVLAIGASRRADKSGTVGRFAVMAALLIGFGSAALLALDTVWALVIAGVVYFAGHAAQSAALPSLVGARFPGARRGTAMGGLNTFTYLGSFVGGPLGALLYLHPPALPVVLLVLGLAAAVALVMSGPRAA